MRESEEDLLKQKSEGKQKEAAHTQIIPTIQHILESYSILSLEEKNRLWKLVLKKVTIYRSPDDEPPVRKPGISYAEVSLHRGDMMDLRY